MKCTYCGIDKPNNNSLRNHERCCKHNPNRHEPSRGMKGKASWNRGLSKETDDRVANAAIKSRETLKNRKGRPQSHETRERLSIIRANALNENAFYSKRSLYKGVTLDSSYELKVAEDLDRNNVLWTRPKSLVWLDGEQKRRYIPDFYLPEYDVYLDPKNDFLAKKDQRKINEAMKYNKVQIFILTKDELSWENIQRIIG